VRAAADLLGSYQHVIHELSFITGSKGVFDVDVDGELLFSKHSTGRHADPGEVLELYEQTHAAGIARYGT